MNLFDKFNNSFTRQAIPVRVAGLCHGVVICGGVQQSGDFRYNQAVVGADELHRASIDCFGSFGGVAHHQHGLAQPGGFFLNAAAVGEHQRALLHQEDKG